MDPNMVGFERVEIKDIDGDYYFSHRINDSLEVALEPLHGNFYYFALYWHSTLVGYKQEVRLMSNGTLLQIPDGGIERQRQKDATNN